MSYEPKSIEKKWQEYWEKNNTFRATDSDDKKEKFYVLDMFPYPSGAGLHVGHPRGYTATDFIAKMMQMKGKNVLHPMGWDAFGLPAENYAIKNKVHPDKFTQKNIENFKKQLTMMGLVYDPNREINTTDPDYYKWTQWIFLQLFKKGLAYEAEAPINWCPSCKTGLANEEVENGLCKRCHTPVERKSIRQWVLKITDYADRLLEDLNKLDWPEPIKEMQRNWIGKSEGATIKFEVKNSKANFVLLHGYTGSPEANFFPWLKKELESRGHSVQTPKLPNTDDPRVAEQVEYVLKNCNIDENTVLVGHSLGGIVAMKLLEKLDKPINQTILIASFAKNKFLDENFPEHTFNWKFDTEKIKNNAGQITILRDLHDSSVPQENTFKLHEIIGGDLLDYKAENPHFCGKIEPTILENVLSTINVFTTRPDTLFGCTYVVLAPENNLVEKLKPQIKNWAEVEKYVKVAKNKSELKRLEQKEKTGVKLEGITAINPVNNQEIPVFVADYVLAHYATGAIMCVPAHDQRDFEFAKKYNLPIIQVIAPEVTYYKTKPKKGLEWIERNATESIIYNPKTKKYLCLEWKNQPWTTFITGGMEEGENPEVTARREIYEETGYKNLKLIKKLGITRPKFYAAHKNCNRKAIMHGFLFKLIDEEKDETSKEEQAIHDLVWLDKKDLKIERIVCASFDFWMAGINNQEKAIEEPGIIINSEQFNGIKSEDVKKEITNWLKEKNLANFTTTYKLRDWIFSRQRYWGEPIPIVHCEKCGLVSLDEKDLPLKLPHVKNYEPTGTGESPLAGINDWVNTKCPKCGGPAKRETNTMPQWAGSCWYYLRYLDPKNNQKLVDEKKEKYFMPVDLYVGGAEHAVLHLLYARFWHKFLFDLKAVSTIEPFQKLVNVGIILAPDGKKMSKSLGNVINPDDLIEEFGADAFRIYEGFIGPFRERLAWDEKGIVGTRRFLERFYNIIIKENRHTENSEIKRKLNQLVQKVEEDIADFNFNTAIASIMEFSNLAAKTGLTKEEKEILIKVLAPFSPHLAEEIWQNLWQNKNSIFENDWPKIDQNNLKESEITLVIQVNGKTRGSFKINHDANQQVAEETIKKDPRLKNYLDNSVKTIFIKTPQKPIAIINFIKKNGK